MRTGANTERQVPVTRQTSDREAFRWIARQLCWERTLDVLRGGEKLHTERRAA